MMYRDTARAGRALGITGAQAQADACGSWLSLVNLHDRWTERVNIRNRDFKGHEADREFPAPPFPGINSIQPIRTVKELWWEGITMHHCVGGYADAVFSGGTYIYRILEPERATLEIRLGCSGVWTAAQIKSFANKPVENQTRYIALSWLQKAQRAGYPGGTTDKRRQQHG